MDSGQCSAMQCMARMFVFLFDVCPMCVVHGNMVMSPFLWGGGINDADHTRLRSKDPTLGMSQEVKS